MVNPVVENGDAFGIGVINPTSMTLFAFIRIIEIARTNIAISH